MDGQFGMQACKNRSLWLLQTGRFRKYNNQHLFCTCSIPLGLHNLAIVGVLCTMSLSSKWGDLIPFYQSGRYHNYILILL